MVTNSSANSSSHERTNTSPPQSPVDWLLKLDELHSEGRFERRNCSLVERWELHPAQIRMPHVLLSRCPMRKLSRKKEVPATVAGKLGLCKEQLLVLALLRHARPEVL